MNATSLFPVGAPVVSRDGISLGEIHEVSSAGVLIGRELGPLVRLPADRFLRGNSGRVVLRLDAADIREPARRSRVAVTR
jgi:hypothetical protein